MKLKNQKKLSCRRHPERFKDEHQKTIAHRLFLQISMSQNNLAKLTELKVKAEEEELGVKV